MWFDVSFVSNAIVMVTLPQPSLVGSHKGTERMFSGFAQSLM